MEPSRFLTQSLKEHPWGTAVTRILAAALQAVDPGAAVRANLHRAGSSLQIDDRRYELTGRVFVVGAGKACAPMARAAVEVLGPRFSRGVVVTKDGYAGNGPVPPGLEILTAGHPVPDARGRVAAGRIAALLDETRAGDLVLALISGGGSALLTSPVEGVSLEDLQNLTQQLLASGAPIQEINTLRKHLETLKGGGLARKAAPASLAALILSDVVGDPLDVIASGPTVGDHSTYAGALRILARRGLLESVPPAVRAHLQRGRDGQIQETPKPGDPLFERVQNLIVGSNRQAALAGLSQARQEGFNTLLLTTSLQGEASQAGQFLAAIARQAALYGEPLASPSCIILGGETTVTLHGDGLGGRNQELALSAVQPLAGLPGAAIVTLATDGGDGPTDAAGAVVTGNTLARAKRLGLDPHDFLARNDSYHFFQPLGDLLKPGPTLTNVNDLCLIVTF